MIKNDSNLVKQQGLDAASKTVQQINFAKNLDQPGNTRMFFIIGEVKETILYFPQEAARRNIQIKSISITLLIWNCPILNLVN